MHDSKMTACQRVALIFAASAATGALPAQADTSLDQQNLSMVRVVSTYSQETYKFVKPDLGSNKRHTEFDDIFMMRHTEFD